LIFEGCLELEEAGTGCQAAVSEAETAAENADADVNGDAYKHGNDAEQHAETWGAIMKVRVGDQRAD